MRDFNHTLSVLVTGYLNNTLEHYSCCACAVGNMVANACGYTFAGMHRGFDQELLWDQTISLRINPSWRRVFITYEDGTARKSPSNYFGDAKAEIDATGYNWEELSRIENAFEMAPKGSSKDEHMFNGLMAVVDVLADIHGIDLERKEEAKSLFVKS